LDGVDHLIKATFERSVTVSVDEHVDRAVLRDGLPHRGKIPRSYNAKRGGMTVSTTLV
jgi:hypothetical protein